MRKWLKTENKTGYHSGFINEGLYTVLVEFVYPTCSWSRPPPSHLFRGGGGGGSSAFSFFILNYSSTFILLYFYPFKVYFSPRIEVKKAELPPLVLSPLMFPPLMLPPLVLPPLMLPHRELLFFIPMPCCVIAHSLL